MKKLLSLLLAVVMILSLCTVAFATDATTVTPTLPTGSTLVSSISGISSIKVNGDTAVYHTDSDGVTYIRAIDNPDSNGNGGTEWDLKNATVVINKTSGTTISCTDVLFTGSRTSVSASGVNLFNKSHELVIGGQTYVLAAGLSGGCIL